MTSAVTVTGALKNFTKPGGSGKPIERGTDASGDVRCCGYSLAMSEIASIPFATPNAQALRARPRVLKHQRIA